jgi:NTE family protein
LNLLKRRDGVHPASGIRTLVEHFSPYNDLSEATIPTHVGAVSVNSGKLTWWDNGSVVDRLCASAAIPGVVSTVKIDGESYFDGGVVANVPLHRAIELGAARVVVLDVSESNFSLHPGSALEVVLRAFTHSRTALTEHEYRSAAGLVEIIRISGDLPQTGASDFEHGGDLSHAGRAIAQEALKKYPELAIRARTQSKSFYYKLCHSRLYVICKFLSKFISWVSFSRTSR